VTAPAGVRGFFVDSLGRALELGLATPDDVLAPRDARRAGDASAATGLGQAPRGLPDRAPDRRSPRRRHDHGPGPVRVGAGRRFCGPVWPRWRPAPSAAGWSHRRRRWWRRRPPAAIPCRRGLSAERAGRVGDRAVGDRAVPVTRGDPVTSAPRRRASRPSSLGPSSSPGPPSSLQPPSWPPRSRGSRRRRRALRHLRRYRPHRPARRPSDGARPRRARAPRAAAVDAARRSPDDAGRAASPSRCGDAGAPRRRPHRRPVLRRTAPPPRRTSRSRPTSARRGARSPSRSTTISSSIGRSPRRP
jgi:hypothetical protein